MGDFIVFLRELGVNLAVLMVIITVIQGLKSKIEGKIGLKWRKIYPVIGLILSFFGSTFAYYPAWTSVLKNWPAIFICSVGLYELWKLYLKKKPEIDEQIDEIKQLTTEMKALIKKYKGKKGK